MTTSMSSIPSRFQVSSGENYSLFQYLLKICEETLATIFCPDQTKSLKKTRKTESGDPFDKILVWIDFGSCWIRRKYRLPLLLLLRQWETLGRAVQWILIRLVTVTRCKVYFRPHNETPKKSARYFSYFVQSRICWCRHRAWAWDRTRISVVESTVQRSVDRVTKNI